MCYFCSPAERCKALADLVSQCTRIESEERPTFAEILKHIEKFTTATEYDSSVII